jgi:MFS family permease
MVRDFFPVEESSRIISMLILILGVSPLLAPTVGSLIATTLGWHWIFLMLAIIVAVIMAVVARLLPEGHQPDPTISFKPAAVIASFLEIFAHAQFRTYALAGAFSFCCVLVYVAGSPIIFMDMYHVSPREYGGIFVLLGFLQLGIGAAVSAGVGLLNARDSVPIVSLMSGATLVGMGIFLLGRNRVARLSSATTRTT